MKKVRLNCKALLWIWIAVFIITCIACDGLVEQKTQVLSLGNTDMEIATPENALLKAAQIVVLFLPLAVLTFRASKETNKKVRFISGLITFWLSLSLLACILILIFG